MESAKVNEYARMMAESFADSPGVRLQLAGIKGGETLHERQMACMIEAFDELGCAAVYGDGEGLALGYFTADGERLALCLQGKCGDLSAIVAPEDLALMEQRAAAQYTVARPDWYQGLPGCEEVYVLQAIAVRPDARGTGVFRKLMEPLLAAAAQRGVPVVLQTMESYNVPKYEHMGFVTASVTSDEALGLTCHDMIWRPGERAE